MVYYITEKDLQRYLQQLGTEREMEIGLPARLADVPGMSIVTDPNIFPTREYYRGRNGRLTISVDSELYYFDLAHNLDLE